MQTFTSPDNKHTIDFIRKAEIRFGPSYYQLRLDGELLCGKIFGEPFIWHPASTFVALQEWLTTNSVKGPVTALTIIDLENKKLATTSVTDKGFVNSFEFKDNLILFKKEYYALRKSFEYELNINEIEGWEDINANPKVHFI